MTATPGNSGHHGSSGRSQKDDVAGGRNGLSDRWSDDEMLHDPQQKYNMTLPDEEKASVTMGSPLIRPGMGEAALIPEGAKMVSGDMTVAAGRGAQEFGAKSSAPKDVRDHVKQVIDQNKSLVRPNVVRRLIVTYTITVAIVAILSIGGQVAVTIYIDNSYSDAAVINISGRQRMLSQLLTKDALALYYIETTPNQTHLQNSTYFLKEMQGKLPLWQQSHDALINGTSPSTPLVAAIGSTGLKSVLDLTAQQQPHFSAMVSALDQILDLHQNGSLAVGTPEFDNFTANVDVLLANEGYFWKAQDNITLEFQYYSNSHLNFVLILTWVLHILVIVTLILEGLFVFWPVARNMQRLINERFDLIRRSLESEAENRGVSILMMGYISHELQHPLAQLTEHLDNSRDFLRSLESRSASAGMPRAEGDASAAAGDPLTGAVMQIEKARMCCELLNTVSGDITNLRNIELGRMALVVEVVDVADVIQQVLSTLAPKVPQGVQLKVDIATEIEEEHRRLDKHRLQQILLNLVDNAFRTTVEGEVVVRAKQGRSPSLLRFEVEDSGEGLTEEQRQSLYEPVLDSSGLREGEANLALYVVRLLVDLQNGKYGTEALPGGGNLHWVELPAVSDGKIKPDAASKMPTLAEDYTV